MTRLYLIRHAEAEGNCYRRAHGHYNSLLTPNGYAQLERLESRFAKLRLDAVYASDLYRARRTARAIADLGGHEVRIQRGLREISLGEWEDKPWGQIRGEDPRRLSAFSAGGATELPGGESLAAAEARMFAAVSDIAREHPDGTAAIVSHGYVIKMMLQRVAGRPLAHLDNASVSQMEYLSGAYRVLGVGQNDFLGKHSTLARQSWWRESGSHETEFRFVPAVFPGDTEAVHRLGQTAWESVYGTEEGFNGEVFCAHCEQAVQDNPRYLQFVTEKDRVVGLIQIKSGEKADILDMHTSLFYIEPAMRGRGLGAQLLGEVVSLARRAGKTGITLRVWHKNLRAVTFYRKMGFREIGQEDGMYGTLLLMRLPIAVPRDESCDPE